jgi:hypothetical protein
VPAQAAGETRFVHFTCCDGEYGQRRISLGHGEFVSIQMEKQTGCKKRGSLVAIHKRMIIGETDCIRSGELSKVRCLVGGDIQRTRKCRVEQTFIT